MFFHLLLLLRCFHTPPSPPLPPPPPPPPPPSGGAHPLARGRPWAPRRTPPPPRARHHPPPPRCPVPPHPWPGQEAGPTCSNEGDLGPRGARTSSFALETAPYPSRTTLTLENGHPEARFKPRREPKALRGFGVRRSRENT